jgi:hypothetical protein
MSVHDVALTVQPSAGHLAFSHPSPEGSRLTFQHFKVPDSDIGTIALAPHNSDARQHVGHQDWPPPLLFDISYGCAALNAWGVRQFVNLARLDTMLICNDDDNDNDNDDDNDDDDNDNNNDDDNDNNDDDNDEENGDGGSDGGDREPYVDVSGVDQEHHQQRHDRDVWADRQEKRKQEAQAVDSQTPDFADIILGLWMHNARKGQHQACAMKAEKTQEKVRTWLDSTKD